MKKILMCLLVSVFVINILLRSKKITLSSWFIGSESELPNLYNMFKIIGILIVFSMANAFFSKFIFDYNRKED